MKPNHSKPKNGTTESQKDKKKLYQISYVSPYRYGRMIQLKNPFNCVLTGNYQLPSCSLRAHKVVYSQPNKLRITSLESSRLWNLERREKGVCFVKIFSWLNWKSCMQLPLRNSISRGSFYRIAGCQTLNKGKYFLNQKVYHCLSDDLDFRSGLQVWASGLGFRSRASFKKKIRFQNELGKQRENP